MKGQMDSDPWHREPFGQLVVVYSATFNGEAREELYGSNESRAGR